jgi:hypothetical protein
MNTPPNLTTPETGCTAAMARVLLADGWTNDPDYGTEPVRGGEIRQLASPDGTLSLRARDVSDGRCFAVLTAARVRTDGKRRRSWSAELYVPSSVALAVIGAARQVGASPDPGGIEPYLAAAGWHERPEDPEEDLDDEFDDYDQNGPLIRTWDAPDGARWVNRYNPADAPAYWIVYRSLAGGDVAVRLTQHAPAPVVAAAALAD